LIIPTACAERQQLPGVLEAQRCEDATVARRRPAAYLRHRMQRRFQRLDAGRTAVSRTCALVRMATLAPIIQDCLHCFASALSFFQFGLRAVACSA